MGTALRELARLSERRTFDPERVERVLTKEVADADDALQRVEGGILRSGSRFKAHPDHEEHMAELKAAETRRDAARYCLRMCQAGRLSYEDMLAMDQAFPEADS